MAREIDSSVDARLLIAWLVCLSSWTLPTSAQITLDADFDHGSLDEAASFVTGDLVELVGRDNFNPGRWKWLYFAADGVQGRTPIFRISDEFVTGGGNLNDHAMVYSYDRENWTFFDRNVRSAANDSYAFLNSQPFERDTVYVAYGLPYPVSRSNAHTSALASSPWVSPTLSGTSDLVVGRSPGGRDDLGRTIPRQDLHGYRITDPDSVEPKAKVVLVGGVHSNETLGNHTLEALVDYLIEDSFEAAALRRRAEFYVYPMVNPDGRLAGYNRSTVEAPSLDPNRFWAPPNYGGQTEIAAIGDAMVADTGGDVDYFIDFHSTVQKGSGHFGFVDVDRDFHLDPFWQSLLDLEPTTGTFDASLTNNTAARFGLLFLDADFTITHETRFLAGENEDRFVTLGRNFGRAFVEALVDPLAGDFNLDMMVDAADYTVWRDNASGEFVESDYETWLSQFGLSRAVRATLPEPSGLIVACGLSTLALHRRAPPR